MSTPETTGSSGGWSARLAARLGWTEGQVQTVAIGAALAVVVTATGIPPALRGVDPLAQAAGVRPAQPPAVDVAPPPAVEVPPAPAGPPPALPLGLVPPGATQLPVFDAPAPAAAPPAGQPAGPEQPVQPVQPVNPTPEVPAGGGDLLVAASAWYADDAVTPLGGLVDPPPPGALPVAVRAAQVSRFSVVRLAGPASATTLRLPLADGGQRLPDSAGVLVCPLIQGDWKPEPAQPTSAAPAVEAGSCVTAERDGGGFTADLGRFFVRTGGNGFALYPVTNDPARPLFQVSLRPQSTS